MNVGVIEIRPLSKVRDLCEVRDPLVVYSKAAPCRQPTATIRMPHSQFLALLAASEFGDLVRKKSPKERQAPEASNE